MLVDVVDAPLKTNKKPSILNAFSLRLLNFISFDLSSTHTPRMESVNDTGTFCPHAQTSRLLVIIESDFWFCLKVSVITFVIVRQNYVSLTYIEVSFHTQKRIKGAT